MTVTKCDRCLAEIEGLAAYAAKRLTFIPLCPQSGLGSSAVVSELPTELCGDCVLVVKRDIKEWAAMRASMKAKS